MTGHAPGHEFFEELAAGYILAILEPADERRFVDHADHCLRCQQALANYEQVAEALAAAAPPAEPSRQLGERILGIAAITEEPAD